SYRRIFPAANSSARCSRLSGSGQAGVSGSSSLKRHWLAKVVIVIRAIRYVNIFVESVSYGGFLNFFLICIEERPDRRETSSMLWCDAEESQALAVLGRSVASVFIPSIVRKLGRELAHFPIACHFCNYRGGGNREAAGVPADDQAARNAQFRVAIAVDQRDIGAAGQGVDGAAHGEQARLQNVELIDLLDRGFTGADMARLDNLREQNFPFRARDFLAVRDPGGNVAPVEDDGGGDNRASERAAPGLIDTRDQARFRIFKRKVRQQGNDVTHSL